MRHFKKFLSLLFCVVFIVGSFLVTFVFLSNESRANVRLVGLSPAGGSYKVGKKFKVKIYVANLDENNPINAVRGKLVFPNDKLRIRNISLGKSIVDYWYNDREFDVVRESPLKFRGIIFSPGFIGESGKLFSVKFQVKKAGRANLRVKNSLMLLSNGRGTRVAHKSDEARFSFYRRDLGWTNFVFGEPKGKQKKIKRNKKHKVKKFRFVFEGFPRAFKKKEKPKKYFKIKQVKKYPGRKVYVRNIAKSQLIKRNWKIKTNVKQNFRSKFIFKYRQGEFNKLAVKNAGAEKSSSNLVLKYYNSQTKTWDKVRAEHNVAKQTFKTTFYYFREGQRMNRFVIGYE